ncbi:putative NADH oxidase [delta proteobacterium NaphS2]|nr:putative NADH oxidase [delta proteobacterium NaphS2]
MENFKELFEPGKIGNLELKNRTVMPAMVTSYATYEGEVTERHLHYYGERAKGGVGLIIVEFTKAEYTLEPWSPFQTLRIDSTKHVSGFSDLVKVIHMNGAKAALQISLGLGSWVIPPEAYCPGLETVGPTEFAMPGAVARALTTEEVEALVLSSGAAALRARMAGFDAIEIHGHASYILGQFMSPFTNKRTDKYGELWQLPVEILQMTKQIAGPDFPVIFRISGDEFLEGGRDLDGSIEICKRMEEAGVDAIDVSGGTYYFQPQTNVVFPYMTLPRGIYVDQAWEIKKAVNVPIIVPGRLSDPVDAERVLSEGKADFIGIGRGLIADPELPNKVADGKLEEICPCIYCNEGCIGAVLKLQTVSCQVNTRVGKEREYKIEPAAKPKKVLVIGGGPGGMEAARVAALRGHDVILYEKLDRLGGHLMEASMAEHKKDIRPLIGWLSSQIKKGGVEVVLGKEVTLDLVTEISPDVVIVAVGATILIPEIPGINESIAVSALDVLTGKADVGNRVVVAGGGLVGCDVAAFLAEKGKEVAIVEMLPEIAQEVEIFAGSRNALLRVLGQEGVVSHTNTTIEEITGKGVIVSDTEGERRTINADTVVIALGLKPETGLYKGLKGKVPEVYAIGDCLAPRKIGNAMNEGFFRANTI